MRRLTLTLTALAAVAAAWPAAARSVEPPAAARPANRLARETSPYLRQHAHNPVDWYPWGEDAFAKARKENKLIFLSVGYSACHWCHVMERESFANADVAKLLNASFVCVKVDREERPDIDQIYQTALQVFRQPGGWPLTMFLTPDGKPIVGGTYLPPDDREVNGGKLIGLKSAVRIVLDLQRDRPQEVRDQADQVARLVAATLGRTGRPAGSEPRRYLVTAAVEGLKGEFDPEYGGFGNAERSFKGPKFPSPPCLGLLLQQAARQDSAELLGMVTRTLDHMAAGGIYDQLGGGFHRYSTERTWGIPHFEKMLYDNAQLAELYARAYERTKSPTYRRVVAETLEFVGREMTAPGGGFYSALDADSDGEEGRYYVWTPADFDAALPDPAENAAARTAFGVGGTATGSGRYFILIRPAADNGPADPHLASARQKLLAVRSKRSRPFLDTKILTGWNGQMIAGYATAGRVFGDARYTETAARAADFILAHSRTIDGRLLRSCAAVPGDRPTAGRTAYLDDYAYLIHGLLCLHDTTGAARWLDQAKALADTMIRYYGDENGGFFLTASDHEKLFARSKDMHDGAQPSGNSAAIRDLLRLAAKTGDRHYRDVAGLALKAFAVDLEQNPTGMTGMAAALDEYLGDKPAASGAPPAGQPAAGQPGGAKRSDAVVKVTATATKPAADGKQTVTVKLTIDRGWHVYANPVGNEGLDSAQTTVAVTGKAKPKAVSVNYPKGKVVKDPLVGDYSVYDDTVEIKATVERAAGDTGPLEVTVKLQACNDSTCLLPATVKLTVP